MIDKPDPLGQGSGMNDDDGDRAAQPGGELALRAGPARPNPPLPIALMILLLGLAAPFVFVRTAQPSPFLTMMALLLPLAGTIAVIGAVESMRRLRADRAIRARAVIGVEGITLHRKPADAEHHAWTDIASADVTATVLTLILRGEGGKRVRRAVRYGRLETPVEMLRGRIAQGLRTGGSVTEADQLS
ncbi:MULTISPECIES: hypothetical protein [unclassified Acidiphilium]|jgi:hypothetical protein|uniref:hypothetical protein n=1 Tax=unclassified Acidiphilium TaxID=2617493 RepID=UPI000BDA761F|nr:MULTISPECIES: hypothetical protein [unclassified Acidiphilium]OYV57658.1 MAG: hypothetical protein B7Z76_00360 [Acidiphilium sp. 20-67-58]OYV83155.1 MAG: hypothetical protein B7Z64_08825 [Acidiphilium sp. 21-68-69]HQT62156.1 hypothetical protein [Acidiphilium sp.]